MFNKKINRLFNKPILFDAVKAHKKGKHKKGGIAYLKNKTALVHTKFFGVRRVPVQNQFDLLQPTFFGLNDRLTTSAVSPNIDTKGTTLRDLFNIEWQKYSKAVLSTRGLGTDYGTYAYYPYNNTLVQYSNEYWHRVVGIASNSTLIADAKRTLSWQQIRDIFEKAIIGIAGCSVGNNIAHSIVMDIRPKNIKIADKSDYKMENINRVRLQYQHLTYSRAHKNDLNQSTMRNKAEVTAEQIYAIDPFINVYTYTEGITAGSITHFFDGYKKEPKLDFLIEEIDDFRTKIELREEARSRKIPLLMMTDVGSSVQMDVLRYDIDDTLPLTYGTDDTTLKNALERVYQSSFERKAIFNFVDALIGKDYRRDELEEIINERAEIPTSTIIPQIGSTAMMAGAIASETVARILLGYSYPKRVILNKKDFSVKKYT